MDLTIKRTLAAGCLAILYLAAGSGQTSTPQKQVTTPRPITDRAAATAPTQRLLIDQYCVSCHNDKVKTGGLSLQNSDLNALDTNAEVWEQVIRKLRAGMMPPPGVRRPPLAQYEGLREFLETEIDKKAAARPNPGSIVLHRLNRTEYGNVIRDLLDLDIDATTLLPSDDLAHGFDNVAGSLTISSTLLEAYTNAATRIARTAIGYWKTPSEAKYIAPGDTSQSSHLEGMPFGTRGGMAVRHNFPADGRYKLSIQNFGIGKYIPGEQLEFLIDGQRVSLQDYVGVGKSQGMSGDDDGSIDITIPVKAGTHTVGATFLATNYGPFLDEVRQYERKSLENNSIPQLQYYPAIGYLRIQGPFDAMRPKDSRSIRKVFTCRPASQSQEQSCANEILSTLMRRAYRRPSTQADLERIANFYRDGRAEGSFEDGIEEALQRILTSPEFLVRRETEPPNVANGQIYRISDLELASRLSFFVWSSLPDDELINLAGQNKLHTSPVLEQQVRRMMADPKAESLVRNFGDQLFYLRNLPGTSPDGVAYPNWDDELRRSFQRETELLFNSVVKEDRNVVDLLTANYTFLNERLAQHYGIPGIYGSAFRRVTLGPELAYRRGLLGQGSMLSVTATQNFRTSPVKRGEWVLDNILGTPPPEPPPNVPPLPGDNGADSKMLTLRQQMTEHRKNEPCATCHKLMDPIGFALENFDADGSFRTKQGGEGGVPLDTSVELWDGTKVNGPAELRQAVLRYSPQFVRMVTEKLMTFALGRGVEAYDMPVLRSIVHNADKENDRFSSIVMGIIKSAPFQMRSKSAETNEGSK